KRPGKARSLWHERKRCGPSWLLPEEVEDRVGLGREVQVDAALDRIIGIFEDLRLREALPESDAELFHRPYSPLEPGAVPVERVLPLRHIAGFARKVEVAMEAVLDPGLEQGRGGGDGGKAGGLILAVGQPDPAEELDLPSEPPHPVGRERVGEDAHLAARTDGALPRVPMPPREEQPEVVSVERAHGHP